MPKVTQTKVVKNAKKAQAKEQAEKAQQANAPGGNADMTAAKADEMKADRVADMQLEEKQTEAADEKKVEQKETEQQLQRDEQRTKATGKSKQQSHQQTTDQDQQQEQETGAGVPTPAAQQVKDQQRDEEERATQDLDESTDAELIEAARNNEERGHDEQAQLDQGEFRDKETEQQKDVAELGTEMLEESSTQNMAAIEQASEAEQQIEAEQSIEQAATDNNEVNVDEEQTSTNDPTISQGAAATETQQQAHSVAVLEELQEQAALADLDDAATQRIMVHNNVDRIRGQIVEEHAALEGQRIAAELRAQEGGDFEFLAEGRVTTAAPSAGHSMNDVSDGMVVQWLDEERTAMEVRAILEAKAGEGSLAGLEHRKTNHSPKELRAQAVDDLRQELAEQEGWSEATDREVNPQGDLRASSADLATEHANRVNELEDVSRQDMGQFRNDIERLIELPVEVDGQLVDVSISPNAVESVAVTPSDVGTQAIFDRMQQAYESEDSPGLRVNGRFADIGLTRDEIRQAAEAALEAQAAEAGQSNYSGAHQQQQEHESAAEEELSAAVDNTHQQQHAQRAAAEEEASRRLQEERKRLEEADEIQEIIIELDD